jgi:hypothetical protein
VGGVADDALHRATSVLEPAVERLDDPALPAFPTLVVEPEPLLAAALAPSGGVIRRVKPRQTTWRPGRSLTVRYDATVSWPVGGATDEVLVATTGRLPDGGLVLEADGVEVAVWRVPHDPWLPGLASACDPGALGHLLDALDVEGGVVSHRLVAYRPGRRAVVRVQRGATTVFVKAVRPDRAGALHRRHRALAAAVPVPRSLGVDPRLGLVVLEALGGTLLRQRLLTAGAALPPAGALLHLLDRLPAPDDGGRAPGWRSDEWADLLACVRPERARDLAALADELTAAEARHDEPLVPVHGDLHEAQLLTRGPDVTGVLDVDTFGVSRRTDDLATLIGHLSTLALATSHRPVDTYIGRLLGTFDRHVDPVWLRYAAAGVVLGLATGPFRVLEAGWPANTDARITLARRWADAARQADNRARSRPRHETSLTPASRRSQVASPA